VTATIVPDHPRLFGDTVLRVDDLLIGPARLKGTTSSYKFVRPSGELDVTSGPGHYPDFAYPTPKGESRFWWATADKRRPWKTADFVKLLKCMPTQVSEALLKAGLDPDGAEARAQADLVGALVRLEAKRTRIEQITVLQEMQGSRRKLVSLTA